MLLLDGAAELWALLNESPGRGITGPTGPIDVIVFVRLPVFNGTGGGIARRVALLLMLRRMVGPLKRRLVTGFGCVGVTVLLLHARDARNGSLFVGGTMLKPSDLQTFLASMIAALI